MKNKVGPILLALIIAFTALVPVSAHAAGNESGWVELLEEVSVQSNGENWWTMKGATATLTIPMLTEKRLRKIDLLLWNATGFRPTKAAVTAGGRTTNLDIYAIGSNLTRITGYLPDAFYEQIDISITKSTTTETTYEVLSCKVTPIGVQEFQASGNVYMDGVTFPFGQHIQSKLYTGGTQNSTIRISVTDWQKYDSLTIWGSADNILFTSFRASYSTSGLPFEINYMQATPSGEWVQVYTDTSGYYWPGEYEGSWESHEDTEGYTITETNGKYLFCITIDLSNVDRTITDPLYLYATGLFQGHVGYTFNCQYVNGNVNVADTSTVSWWTRFTTFMRELMGVDTTEDEELQQEAQDKTDELGDLNAELESVTRPDPEDIDASLSDFVNDDDLAHFTAGLAPLTNDDLFGTILVMGLSVALLGYILYGKR